MLRWIVLVVMLSCRPLLADDSFFAESCDMPFPEAMTVLQEAVASQGYTVSRVQHVDKGLRLRGYETGLYRVVFFGRPQQMAAVRRNYPVLMSYLPLKITLFEDDGRVVASTLRPATLSSFFDDEEIRQLLNTWQKDMTKIMLYYRRCGEAAGSL